MNKSLWAEGFTSQQFPPLAENLECDVAIIGGGLSGLWSAFHLLKVKPELKIALFEARHIGYGASGRNGGWISADYPVYRSTLEKRHGKNVADLVFASLKNPSMRLETSRTTMRQKLDLLKAALSCLLEIERKKRD